MILLLFRSDEAVALIITQTLPGPTQVITIHPLAPPVAEWPVSTDEQWAASDDLEWAAAASTEWETETDTEWPAASADTWPLAV